MVEVVRPISRWEGDTTSPSLLRRSRPLYYRLPGWARNVGFFPFGRENPIGSFLIPGLLFRPFERSISSSIHPSRPPAFPGIECGWTKILIIAQVSYMFLHLPPHPIPFLLVSPILNRFPAFSQILRV